MQITTLNLRNFRNYAHLDLSLRAGATLFYGPNAAGKTSILEAVALLALSRSPRTHSDRELVFWQANHTPETPATARVTGMITRQHGPTRLDVIIQQRGDLHSLGGVGGTATKVLRVDQKPVRASDLLGFLRVVFFAPTDLALLTGAPSERRRWLDAMLSQLDHHYLLMLNQYTKVITQRNALLRQWREHGRTPRNASSELAFWDEQLALNGAYISIARTLAINELQTLAQPIYTKISDKTTDFFVEYVPNIAVSSFIEKEVSDQLIATYRTSHREDMTRGQTCIGPHRDDINVRDGTMDLGTYGSRGQQRSGVMALKLAEVEFMTQRTGERPVLLLDDVLSELDLQRRRHLLALMSLPAQQTLLTATGIEDFDAQFLRTAQLMRVDNAHVFDLSS